ncbi:MAG: YicC/YloC family endoribonuclease [Muribaculaceae bacterium]
MLYSMTGFGRVQIEFEGKKLTVEIKSLNSKQLDMSVRLPQPLRIAEAELRNVLGAKLQRGKVDVNVTLEQLGGEAAVKFNLPVLKAYKEQISDLSRELDIPEPADWYSVLLRFADTMHADQSDVADANTICMLLDGVEGASESLMEHRREEGLRLETFFAQRIDKIADLLAQVPRYENERIAKIRSRIEDGLASIPNVEYDKGRLEQEMIFYIEKLDINEEKQRLAQHLKYFIETMDDTDGGQGKKLGFIAQEMGREINTLGSKSNQAEMQILVVKMKDELEQIKEQVLNVM